jgi:hypothetical protein
VPYVYANVKVKYGQLPAFFEQMVTIKRVMEENGWKLVGAWSTVIGDIHEVHDPWEVEDANSVPAGFAGAFEDVRRLGDKRDSHVGHDCARGDGR